jgi:hypothetical protein
MTQLPSPGSLVEELVARRHFTVAMSQKKNRRKKDQKKQKTEKKKKRKKEKKYKIHV